ncbi:MAG: tRNA (guanosine(46)-N7)-methyltransferase TrmB [Clostridia bacterium]|nr:tRNA (guanosine(46)-N7)-methyltransferase TrmB [Clostridia bacterium]
MRMRKKKNLEPRLAACADITIELGEQKPDWQAVFGNSNPLHLEIGCGKGAFTEEIARRNPDINFVAIEMEANVAVMAMEKIKAAKLPNVRFMVVNADKLLEIFEENAVERIYLNFSCPFPKKRHTKHRLTYEAFLNRYKVILPPGKEIHLKTDKEEFFDFSIEEFEKCGWELKNITRDLHHSAWAQENIVTEYESRFTALGQPIFRLEAVNNKK